MVGPASYDPDIWNSGGPYAGVPTICRWRQKETKDDEQAKSKIEVIIPEINRGMKNMAEARCPTREAAVRPLFYNAATSKVYDPHSRDIGASFNENVF